MQPQVSQPREPSLAKINIYLRSHWSGPISKYETLMTFMAPHGAAWQTHFLLSLTTKTSPALLVPEGWMKGLPVKMSTQKQGKHLLAAETERARMQSLRCWSDKGVSPLPPRPGRVESEAGCFRSQSGTRRPQRVELLSVTIGGSTPP